jgi:hypothetical protein
MKTARKEKWDDDEKSLKTLRLYSIFVIIVFMVIYYVDILMMIIKTAEREMNIFFFSILLQKNFKNVNIERNFNISSLNWWHSHDFATADVRLWTCVEFMHVCLIIYFVIRFQFN